MANPVNVPRELNGVCKNLARLYRIYDASTHTEYFGLHPPHRTYALGAKQPRNVFGELGYCSTKQGDCGADIPLLNAGSSKPVCYLFPSHRDLKTVSQKNKDNEYMTDSGTFGRPSVALRSSRQPFG